MASSSRAGGRAADTASASQPGDASSRPRGSASASQPGPVQLQRCPRPIVQMPYGWPPDRCNRCRRLTMWFGCGASWNDIALANCCMVCSLEMAVEIKSLLFDQRAVVDTMCAKDERLPVQVLRDHILGALILEYAIHLEYGSRSPKLCEEHVQGHIWMRVLRGKYDWNFDCGEAVCDPFSGFFGVSSVNFCGTLRPASSTTGVVWNQTAKKAPDERFVRRKQKNNIAPRDSVPRALSALDDPLIGCGPFRCDPGCCKHL